MRKMKSLVLAVMGLLCSMSVSAHDFYVNGIYYNITSQADKTVAVTYRGSYYHSYYDEYSGEVKIPESVTYSGNTYSVTSIGYDAFSWCSSLTSVEIPNSVTSIGGSAFYNCSSLTSVELPNSVTSIGDYAFQACSSLTSVEIPNSVTSIGSSAFSGTVWYNNQPDGVIYVGKVLYKYKGTMPANTSITIEDGTVSISPSAFFDCSSLTSVEIPNSVTSIGTYAFSECSSLTSVEIPNSVTSIGTYAFSDCSRLTSVTIGNSVTSIGRYAFEYCSSLTSVEIPNSVTSIGTYAFSECSSLTSVKIPNSVTSIGSSTFRNCSSLTSVEIPNSVTSIGSGAFYGTAWYNNQPDGVIYVGKVLYEYKGAMTANTSITIEDGTVSISPKAFWCCSRLTSVKIPNSVTSIGYSAFSDCI